MRLKHMALRSIVTEGDEVLRKKSKEVINFGERTSMLLDDMWETMREADGVGLAAPQVGVLRRAIVIDVTDPAHEGDDSDGDPEVEPVDDAGGEKDEESEAAELPVNAPGGSLYELLNPEVVESEGEASAREGCLSVPGVSGLVKRPERVTVRATGRNGEEIVVEGEGILAKALCHEIDHLNGVLFIDIAEEIEKQEPQDAGVAGVDATEA
jgi:peptide deformylase